MTLSSYQHPRCQRLDFGRENGATLTQEPAMMQRLEHAQGDAAKPMNLRRQPRWKTGTQSRAQLTHSEEAISPRQGQECLLEKGVIPPGTPSIKLKNKPNEQRPPDLKSKALNRDSRSHVSKESPQSNFLFVCPKTFHMLTCIWVTRVSSSDLPGRSCEW